MGLRTSARFCLNCERNPILRRQLLFPIVWVLSALFVDSGSGRAKLRLSRGFPLRPALSRQPPRIQRSNRLTVLTCVANGLGSFLGGDVLREATRKAPAQAELRPTCAGAPPYLTLPGASSVCSKIAHEEEQELETELILVIGTRNVLCGARQQLG